MSVDLQNYKQVYQFKITLKDSKPSIWRRIQVPETYSFWDLHVAIQDAMGWSDSHLHEFKIADPVSKDLFTIGFGDEEYDSATVQNFLEDYEVPIREWFATDNNRAEYIYDFGDNWEHTVQLERILPRRKGVPYPTCIAGKRACPPEDCGGLPAYKELLEILADPSHPKWEGKSEWRGTDLKPEYFNPFGVVFDDPGERWEAATEDNPLFLENP